MPLKEHFPINYNATKFIIDMHDKLFKCHIMLRSCKMSASI